MISKEDEEKVLKFSSEYKSRVDNVCAYKNQLHQLQNKVTSEIKELEKIKTEEIEFLEHLKIKYNTSTETIVQKAQQIVLSN